MGGIKGSIPDDSGERSSLRINELASTHEIERWTIGVAVTAGACFMSFSNVVGKF